MKCLGEHFVVKLVRPGLAVAKAIQENFAIVMRKQVHFYIFSNVNYYYYYCQCIYILVMVLFVRKMGEIAGRIRTRLAEEKN